MRASIRVGATSVAAALLASSMLASPLLAAKPSTGGGGGGTTTTAFTGSFVATPEGSIVVGSPTKVTFKYTWSNGADRTLRLVVPPSYTAPQMTTDFSASTGLGAGWVGAATFGTCSGTGPTVSGTAISISTGTCASGTVTFDFYALTFSTGAAKFPVFVDGATTASTAYATMTLNASSAKVSITGITAASSPVTSVAAGTTVRVALKVTDSKGKVLVGVPLLITDNAGSTWVGGELSCASPMDWLVCTNNLGVATADLEITEAGQHQLRAAVHFTSYSGQRSISATAGPLDTLELTESATGDLELGETRDFTVAGTDAYGNTLPFAVDDIAWLSDGDGDVTFADEIANADGSVTVTATGDVVGETTVTADATELTASTTFDVIAGAIASFTLTPSATGDLASDDTRTLTAHAENAFGTQISLTTGDVDWTTGGGEETFISFGTANDAGGDVSIVVTGQLVGTVTVTATLVADSMVDDTTFTVVPGTLDSFTLSSDETGDLTAGDTRKLTVTALDANGNAISLSTGDVDWTTGTGEETFASFASETGNGDGSVSITVTGELTGGVTVTASLAAAPGTQDATSFTVVAGAYAKVVILGSVADLATGTTVVTLTVVATDAKGNPVDQSLATFQVVSGDTGVVTVGTLNGDGTFDVTAVADGSTTITASDGVNGAITTFELPVTVGSVAP